MKTVLTFTLTSAPECPEAGWLSVRTQAGANTLYALTYPASIPADIRREVAAALVEAAGVIQPREETLTCGACRTVYQAEIGASCPSCLFSVSDPSDAPYWCPMPGCLLRFNHAGSCSNIERGRS